jgi:general secretion pathway protein D
MILTTCKRHLAILLCWFLLIAVSASHPLEAQETPASSSGRSTSDEQYVSIDFNDVDINVFIKFISELTGTNFVVDPRVRGKVTIISPSKISIAEAYKVFESVLEVHGFATVKAGDVVKIIPAPDARSKDIETKLKEEFASPEDKIITQLIPLRYADADEIKRLFTPLVSKSSVILSYTPTNMLIVTDVQSNIQRLLKILKQIDVTGMGLEISVIPLDYGDATKVVNLLNTIFKSGRKPTKGESERAVTMVADERTNTIVVLANEVDILRIKQLISMIDKETPRGKGKINVYYLKNASAEDLAKVLQELPGQHTGAAPGKEALPVVSEKVRITADKATNSLIIMADKEDYAVLAEVIQKLDVPRSMVYIEALIMEVNVDRSLDLGIDWQVFGETDVAGKNTAVGGGFSDAFPSLQSLVKGGLTLGLISEPTNIAGFTLSNISAIINAVKTDDDFRILSTPQVITTDNEEARITIGSNRPFQTRSTTDTSGQSFLSYEYRDVGKILKITPHVTEGRLVRLTMSLEVTDIDRASTLTTGSTLPVTNKRTVDTTVIVKDNHTVVIGGLIEDSSTGNQKKVPVLGDIPVLGWLFRKDSNLEQRTNLYIFLTPRVIQHPDEADKVFLEKKGQIDSVRKGEIKLYQKPKQKEPPKETETAKPPGSDLH